MTSFVGARSQSPDAVTTRSGATASVRRSTVSAHIRSPTASVRMSPIPTAAASKSAGPSSRSETTTTSPGSSPARSKSVIIRGRTNTGSRSGRKERARHPAMRILRLAKGRDRALDAREVFQVQRTAGGRGDPRPRRPCAPRGAVSALNSRTHSRVLGRATKCHAWRQPRLTRLRRRPPTQTTADS